MPLGAFKAALMGTAGVSTGDVVLLSTQTASSSSAIAITSGIDSTYGEYIFKFYNIHPATNNAILTFQVSIDGGSNYNVAITSSAFQAYHAEADDNAGMQYDTGQDLAQGTGYQTITGNIGNGNDESGVCELHLFNPSSTTYVKHWYAHGQVYHGNDESQDFFHAGYANSTSAVNAINFKMSSGNIDAGTIKMWGVK